MHGDDPTYLIGCMRTQISNLWELALHSDLSQAPNDDQKTAVVTLLKECRDALYGFNPLTPQAQSSSGVATSPLAPSVPTQTANGAFSRPVAFAPTGSTRPGRFRTASTQSQIESNTKAAMGAMAYLNDPNLFGQQGQALYAFIQYRLQQGIALMEGSVSLGDVVGERQRLLAQQQQEGAQTVQPQQMPYQSVTSIVPTAPSASGAGQSPAPSPVAGLVAKSPPWDGTTNTTKNGEETVGSGQDWFSTYGTTLEKFAERCSRWLRANGGGQAALVTHLRANTVPENVIVQTMVPGAAGQRRRRRDDPARRDHPIRSRRGFARRGPRLLQGGRGPRHPPVPRALRRTDHDPGVPVPSQNAH